jgi:hypothetical protein
MLTSLRTFGCKLFVCTMLVAVTVSSAGRARAQVQPSHEPIGPPNQEKPISDADAARALAVGVLVAGLGLAAGGAAFSASTTDGKRVESVYLAQGGLTLAPLVSHAMLGQYGAGAVAALPPAGASVAMFTFLTIKPHAVTGGGTLGQYTFSILLAATVFSSIFGVTRVLPSAPADSSQVSLLPSVDRDHLGFELRGRL